MNTSGRANRVAPDGSTHAVADRGLFWGNRGRLLDARGVPARHSLGRNWIVCVLQFHGRHRTQWQPNRLTELYFLDEATGLAAGHRPCGECRHADYVRYREAWSTAFPGADADARSIDRRLHDERLAADRVTHRTHDAEVDGLPDGVIIELDGVWWLVRDQLIHRWSFAGYTETRPRDALPPLVTVRTPPATVATIRAGFTPVAHPSAAP